MIAAGFDLSYAHTGISTPGRTWAVHTAPKDGDVVDRCRMILAGVREALSGVTGETVLIVEDLPKNVKFGGPILGMVHGVIRLELADHKGQDLRPQTCLVTPASLKTYATGKGNAKKADMVASAQTLLGFEGKDDNEADALWLRAIGHHLTGNPLIELPQTHTRALAKIVPPAILKGI